MAEIMECYGRKRREGKAMLLVVGTTCNGHAPFPGCRVSRGRWHRGRIHRTEKTVLQLHQISRKFKNLSKRGEEASFGLIGVIWICGGRSVGCGQELWFDVMCFFQLIKVSFIVFFQIRVHSNMPKIIPPPPDIVCISQLTTACLKVGLCGNCDIYIFIFL